MPQVDQSNPYEEVYKDSSTFLKVRNLVPPSFNHTMSHPCHVSLIMLLQPVGQVKRSYYRKYQQTLMGEILKVVCIWPRFVQLSPSTLQ